MEDKIKELNLEIVNLVDKYSGIIMSYEIGHCLISNAVSMMLCTAPNELVGLKTILACVQSGVQSYEETHS